MDVCQSPDKVFPWLNPVKNLPLRSYATTAAFIAEGMIVWEEATFIKIWKCTQHNLLDLACLKNFAPVIFNC